MYMYIYIRIRTHTDIQPIPLGVIFSNAVSKAQSSKLEGLFSLKRGKRDFRALSFELSKMTPQVGLAVHVYLYVYVHGYVLDTHMLYHIYISIYMHMEMVSIYMYIETLEVYRYIYVYGYVLDTHITCAEMYMEWLWLVGSINL